MKISKEELEALNKITDHAERWINDRWLNDWDQLSLVRKLIERFKDENPN